MPLKNRPATIIQMDHAKLMHAQIDILDTVYRCLRDQRGLYSIELSAYVIADHLAIAFPTLVERYKVFKSEDE